MFYKFSHIFETCYWNKIRLNNVGKQKHVVMRLRNNCVIRYLTEIVLELFPVGNGDHFLRTRCLNYRNNHPGNFFFPERFPGFFLPLTT